MINPNIDENIKHLEGLFTDCDDLVKREFPIGVNAETRGWVIYVDMLSDRAVIDSDIVLPLMVRIKQVPPGRNGLENTKDLLNVLKDNGMTTADLRTTKKMDDVTLAVLSGDTGLFIDGCDEAIIIASRGFPNRGVQQPETEIVVNGPKDAFTEIVRMNTMLVRRRIRDTNLKMKQMVIGTRSQTDVAIAYLDGVVRPEVLDGVMKSLEHADIDALYDSSCVEQLVEGNSGLVKLFPKAQFTERPDKAASAILEGRVAIIVDNSPFVALVPVTMNVFFQSGEDYYDRWQMASFIRILRYTAGFLAITAPGLYLALTLHHPSMLPTLLAFKLAAAREPVPFPGIMEVLLMELAFELLREAGLRLPSAIGSTMGIIGGLIIGQAAVAAGIVSPIVVIVVAISGISSFAVPNVKLSGAFRLLKFFIIFAVSFLGLVGFIMALLLIAIHLVSIKSFGIPYLHPYTSGSLHGYHDMQDSIIRMPWHKMCRRPIFANPKHEFRIANVESKQDEE